MTPKELCHLVPRPNPADVNTGLTGPTAADMIARFGRPGPLSDDCAELYANYRGVIVTESVGPFTVTGHKTAVMGLRHVMDDVLFANRQDLLSAVQTDGMLCCRRIRGRSSYSNHSWGMAVDINFGTNPPEEMGDGLVQQGLLEIYPFFHKRGWYSGIGYHGREDGMHMEPSIELLDEWKSLGLL